MLRHYKVKAFILLSLLLLLFAFAFIVSILNPSFNFIEVGLPTHLANKVISLFSFCSLILVLWNLKNL